MTPSEKNRLVFWQVVAVSMFGTLVAVGITRDAGDEDGDRCDDQRVEGGLEQVANGRGLSFVSPNHVHGNGRADKAGHREERQGEQGACDPAGSELAAERCDESATDPGQRQPSDNHLDHPIHVDSPCAAPRGALIVAQAGGAA